MECKCPLTTAYAPQQCDGRRSQNRQPTSEHSREKEPTPGRAREKEPAPEHSREKEPTPAPFRAGGEIG